ncbi:MAG: hypothetical protein J3K34DRAFT_454200, partial [Monoraphidium minutum]
MGGALHVRACFAALGRCPGRRLACRAPLSGERRLPAVSGGGVGAPEAVCAGCMHILFLLSVSGDEPTTHTRRAVRTRTRARASTLRDALQRVRGRSPAARPQAGRAAAHPRGAPRAPSAPCQAPRSFDACAPPLITLLLHDTFL